MIIPISQTYGASFFKEGQMKTALSFLTALPPGFRRHWPAASTVAHQRRTKK
jgi:hypothetical protein